MSLRTIFLTLAILTLIVAPVSAIAQEPGGTSGAKLTNPLNNINSLTDFVQKVLQNIVMPIGAVVVVFFVIYAGYLFVTAGGDETKLKKAKGTFLWVIIGAAVLLGSLAISLAIENTVRQIAPGAF